MSDCFIIMPLTTPDHTVASYSAGADHFTHVLEDLFKPAVTQAGFNPVLPIAKGAELIHAEIIKNIEQADMVLCDMSTLNPNVFFELGIRTAVNKPVCMVKDDKTAKVPFDNAFINYYTYDSSLLYRVVLSEVDKLAQHIKVSAAGDKDNQLWKHFSLRARAELEKGKSGNNDRLDLLLVEMQALRKKFEGHVEPPTNDEILPKFAASPYGSNRWSIPGELEAFGKALANTYDLSVAGVFMRADGNLEVFVNEETFNKPSFHQFMAKLFQHTGKPALPVLMSPVKPK